MVTFCIADYLLDKIVPSIITGTLSFIIAYSIFYFGKEYEKTRKKEDEQTKRDQLMEYLKYSIKYTIQSASDQVKHFDTFLPLLQNTEKVVILELNTNTSFNMDWYHNIDTTKLHDAFFHVGDNNIQLKTKRYQQLLSCLYMLDRIANSYSEEFRKIDDKRKGYETLFNQSKEVLIGFLDKISYTLINNKNELTSFEINYLKEAQGWIMTSEAIRNDMFTTYHLFVEKMSPVFQKSTESFEVTSSQINACRKCSYAYYNYLETMKYGEIIFKNYSESMKKAIDDLKNIEKFI